MAHEEDLTGVILQIYKIITNIGEDRFVKEMSKINFADFSEYEEKLKKTIITETCLLYNVDPKDLNAPYVTGDDFTARQTCFILLKQHLALTHKKIAIEFGRTDHGLVSTSLSNYLKMKVTNPQDKRFLENFKALDEIIENRKDEIIMNKQEEL